MFAQSSCVMVFLVCIATCDSEKCICCGEAAIEFRTPLRQREFLNVLGVFLESWGGLHVRMYRFGMTLGHWSFCKYSPLEGVVFEKCCCEL